jgi:hypothetical protein
MDVIGFLCVSLGSSTVQLHDSLSTEARALFQRLVSVVKLTTVFEEYITEQEFCFALLFLLTKGLNAKNIHKEIFLFTVGRVCLQPPAQDGSSLADFFYPEDGGDTFL